MDLESGKQKELNKLYSQLEGLGRHSWEPDLKVVLPLVLACGILGSFLGVLGYRWMQLPLRVRQSLTPAETLREQVGEPGRQVPTEGEPPAVLAPQRAGSQHSQYGYTTYHERLQNDMR